MFTEHKAALANVSEAEWAALPDVGDHTLKAKPRQAEVYTPMVDTLIAGKAKELKGETDKSVAADDGMASVGVGLSAARNNLISQTLTNISDSVGGQSVIDPKVSKAGRVKQAPKARPLPPPPLPLVHTCECPPRAT